MQGTSRLRRGVWSVEGPRRTGGSVAGRNHTVPGQLCAPSWRGERGGERGEGREGRGERGGRQFRPTAGTMKRSGSIALTSVEMIDSEIRSNTRTSTFLTLP